jgi:photosystem II stability/assembly factor-like uncharacterized protein
LKTRLILFTFLVVLSLLVASCNHSVPAATATVAPTLPKVHTQAVPTSTPTSPPPAIVHVPAGQAISILKIHMLDASSGWGIGSLSQAQDHVFRTLDGGVTWRDVTPPQPTSTTGEKTIAIGDFQDASTAWVIYGTGTFLPPAFLYLWFTHDGGETWQQTPIAISISSESFSPWYIDFVDALHGWLLVYLGAGMNHNYIALFGTTDGGLTWNTLVTPEDSVDIQSCPKTGMVFFDARDGWLARECKGLYPAPHIMHTTDGGVTWERIEPPAPADTPNLFTDYACDMASPNPFSASSVIMVMKCLSMADFLTEKDYVYSTTDGGINWNSYPLPVDYSMGEGISFFDLLNGFAFGHKIYKTMDGGKTWTFVQQVFWSGQFSFISPNQGWASVINDSDQNALVKTSNGGVRWEMLNPMVIP